MIHTLYVKHGSYQMSLCNMMLTQTMEPTEWPGKKQQLGTTGSHRRDHRRCWAGGQGGEDLH